MDKVRVIKEHPNTKDFFPLDFETTYTKVFSKEDKTSEGFWTSIEFGRDKNRKAVASKSVYVEPTLQPKGTFLDVVFIDCKGREVCGDWFYKVTGRSFTEFVEKI